ncbi:MAG: xanthine dehydrogenase family protein molybdopterin-binding subunit, partial [Alphaproteobacteria bacterium]|nr:xanthine dehydrogenase family protein molybdopterin-binding subunit [Alphaproteobacteria bacterium]
MDGERTTRGVGERLPRLDAGDKVSGNAKYSDDLYRPGMLHGALLGSPYPFARITGYDVSAARALPGVKAVLTGEDIPLNRWGGFINDETALAAGYVRYVGEPVAAVAASDPATARRALELIEIDYEECEPVLTIEAALAANAPLVHPNFASYDTNPGIGDLGPNLVSYQEIIEGDTGTAWAECDVVVENSYTVQAQSHVYIEPCSALAEIDAAGKVTVWSANQSIYKVQATLSKALGLPMSKIRAITPPVGGAFGGKSGVTIQPITVLLAQATGRPVKLTLSRTDDMMMMRSRHAARIDVKTGAKRDGTLIAHALDITYDGGAYAEDSAAVLGFGLLMARGPYNIPHSRLTGRVVYTNKLRAGGFRGFGNPQVTFATECQIDQIAERLGIDPIDLRLQNAIATGDRWVGGQRVTSSGFRECLERARDAADWPRRRKPAPAPGKRRGIGVAGLAHICGLLGTSAIVRVLEDGTVTLNTGAVDIGQGSDTALAQICASALKLDVEQINLVAPDSDASPYNWGTGGSRVTYMVGRAVEDAAGDAARQMFRHASEILECAEADLELRDGGRIGIVGVPEKSLGFAEISGRAHYVTGGPVIGTRSLVYDGEEFDPKRAVMTNFPFARIGTYVFGAQIVEVEVDEVTGQVEVLEAWS